MKKLTSLFLVLLCLVTMAGCDGNNPPDNKNTDWTIVTQATCTQDGLQERYVDGELNQETIPALGHDYGEWTVTLEETCDTDGKQERQCSRCTAKEEQTIDAHHVLKETFTFDENSHYYECENCGETFDSCAHDFATTKEDKYAYIDVFMEFGDSISSILDKVNIGYVETMTCSECDVKIKDAKLLSRYFSDDFNGCSEYVETLQLSTSKLGILYGNRFYVGNEYLFEYDANYNLTKVSYGYVSKPDYYVEANYTYDGAKLSQISFSSKNSNGWFCNFSYEDSGMVITEVTSAGKNTGIYEYDNNGVLYSVTIPAWSSVNGETVEYISDEMTFDDDGYVVHSVCRYYYDTEFIVIEKNHTNMVDSNGLLTESLITTDYNDDNTKAADQTYALAYNDANQLLSLTKKDDSNPYNYAYIFEYDGNKLVKMSYVYSDYTYIYYTYQYSENTIQVYDGDNTLKLEVEYISDRNMVD